MNYLVQSLEGSERACIFPEIIENKYAHMSPGNKKIADYIYNNFGDILFCTLAELAGHIGVSTASIVRFSHLIGYSGYSDMLKSFQAESKSLSIMQKSSRDLINNNGFDRIQAEKICDMLKSANIVYILGYMDAFGSAAEMLHRLFPLRDNVHFARFLPGWDDILGLLQPGTVVFLVSFAPHYLHTINSAKAAKSRGCKIVTLTDSKLNPYVGLCDDFVYFDLTRNPKSKMYDITPVFAYIDFLFDVWFEGEGGA
ncbi:MAG: MurR/RpiR family transcriptional regulator [Treponema sp.]|nr:MurR/RpiR family transcriptional regulator [Treponema sp.]